MKPDLYKYQLPPNIFDLKVIVSKLGSIDKKLANIKVVIIGSDSSKIEGITDRKGNVFFDLKPNGEKIIKENTDYTITAYKVGSEKNKSETQFTTRGLRRDQNFIIDVPLLIPEEKIRIPEVRYAFGKWELLQDSTISSKDSLNFVYDVLMKYPKMILELSSHTDSRGSDDLNLMLSNNRAKECIRYLVEEKGIDVRRLIPVGKGEKEPVKWIDEKGKAVLLTEKYINQFKEKNLAKFEKLHALNRRTEGLVRGMDFDPDLAEQRLLQPMEDLKKAKKEKKGKKKKKNKTN
jgi:outer membrane protein OmpA-like peptidoglycan-associated protein